MSWEVEVTDEFKGWWNGLTVAERVSVERSVLLLEERGPNLQFPYSSAVNGSRHSAMRELRVQHQGRPYRVLYVFDPYRVALLLLGGDKTGDDRWYEKNVPLADQLYDNYLVEIKEEKDAKDYKIQ
ncbi:MAG TPA: type II toxin-antitoxin system RelE/ParE family toxin [Bryobacteraceae bacterium]|nr:type II toxin-antitoxin system RelE/ParE family toxin [Bryobacteraceae bacterium]